MKDYVEEIVDYLMLKVSKVNVINPKANRGCVIYRMIPDYESKLQLIAEQAISTIITNLARSDSSLPAGMARLTTVATLVGQFVFQTFFGKQEPAYQEQCHGGAPVLEAMIDTGLIEIKVAPGYSGNGKDDPYVIIPTAKWDDAIDTEELPTAILRYTVAERPADIVGLMQPQGYPIIKNWHNYTGETEAYFNDNYVDAPFVRSLDRLQQTAFTINKPVLEAVLRNTTQLVPKKLPLYGNSISKVKLNEAYAAYKDDPSNRNKNRYNKISKQWERTLEPLQARAKRLEARLTLSKAVALSEWDEFYSLVDCDYRSRTYYKEPYMQYQGNDIARGLILFKEAKPIDDEGKRALAIHTANSFNQKYHVDELPKWLEEDYKAILDENQIDTISVDKFSLEDRVNWFNNHWDLIEDTAVNSIFHGEKKVVFFACCVEWMNIADAEELGLVAMTQIPVAIDGTCNGYQHSAALSKDEKTGELVALLDSKIPDDLYVKVAHKLSQISPDFFKDRPMPYSEIRKYISKRSTMTRAYSAGPQTIADSMYSDCVQGKVDTVYNITQIDCDVLAHDAIAAIEAVCPGSQKVMNFLQDLAAWDLGKFQDQDAQGNKVSKTKKKKLRTARNVAAKTYKEHPTDENLQVLNDATVALTEVKSVLLEGNGAKDIRWTTPSGFPVIYAPKMTREEDCSITIRGIQGGHAAQKGRVTLVGQIYTDVPHRRGISAGIAPNMIHSKDASHMAGVINEFDGAFGAVHDSFSCHAGDIARLKEITANVFADMYQGENPLEDLKKDILGDTAVNCNIPTPELGTLDIQEVRTSTHFFA